MRNCIIVLVLLFVVTSCKTRNAHRKKDKDNTIKVDSTYVLGDDNPKDVNSPIRNKLPFFEHVLIPPKFEQIKINSKVNVETGSFIPTLDATIYIEKDKKVWMNLTALLFNVARGIATPEGIKGLDKTSKSYIDSDFDYLNNLLNVNFIDYAALEKILIGRTFIKMNDSQFTLTKNAQGYKMASNVNQKFENEEKKREYKTVLQYDNNYDLLSVNLRDVLSSDELEISYSNWEEINGIRLPRNVKIIIKGSKNSQIFLENTKFDFSKMETPYSVPSSYKKIEIK
ncbi:DUF4292 domain-containing protein [Chryseobacterium sp. MMS23-Vi53]|uniref:DUF4292 domain-containing protein n=1 Tax=Chryseobacterium sp. MMS23-Vi53 TaxID=3386644 RepID=UPI0039E82408